MRDSRWVCASTRSRRRPTSSLISRSSSVAGSIGAQVGAGADLVGDGAGVARVGLVLAADGALAGAVDRQARHVDEREAGLGQHGFGQAGDAADDVEPMRTLPPRRGQLGRRGWRCRLACSAACGRCSTTPSASMAVTQCISLAMSIPTLIRMAPLRRLKVRHPARAVVALHSDGSQSLISGRGGVAVPGDLPPEPSRAASMKTIPTPPPRRDPGMPGSRRQALLAQHLNGRAA